MTLFEYLRALFFWTLGQVECAIFYLRDPFLLGTDWSVWRQQQSSFVFFLEKEDPKAPRKSAWAKPSRTGGAKNWFAAAAAKQRQRRGAAASKRARVQQARRQHAGGPEITAAFRTTCILPAAFRANASRPDGFFEPSAYST